MGHLASAIIGALPKFCVVYLPRTKIFLFLLSIRIEELLTTPKIMTFSPSLPSVYETSVSELSHMLWLPYLYLNQHFQLVLLLQISNYLV